MVVKVDMKVILERNSPPLPICRKCGYPMVDGEELQMPMTFGESGIMWHTNELIHWKCREEVVSERRSK